MSHPQTTPHASAPRQSFAYKAVAGREIAADVIGARPGACKPCVVWIHGGGLIFGSRTASPRASLVQALLERGFVIVSIDHRLAPETKLPGIVEDVRDAWRWVHDVGPLRFGIDPARVAMAGASAGAYLSLLGGSLFEPRPRALASLFGYGDITAPWEAEPSAHYRQSPLVTREEADAALAAPPLQDPAVGVDRSVFYLYCRQQGTWLQEVTAHDPREDGGWFDRYCPLRTITPDFPPTLLVHGTADTDVPHEESVRLAARLAELNVEHRFVSIRDVGHGFAGARPEEVAVIEGSVAEFLYVRLAAGR